MTEHPILFSGEMVRAILDNRKTQTRSLGCLRILKPQPIYSMGQKAYIEAFCPFGIPGDRLWVRETFQRGWPTDDDGRLQYTDSDGKDTPEHVWFRASYDPIKQGYVSQLGALIQGWIDENDMYQDDIPWRPSIFMPRWASRITLEITEVRVQRLQEIDADDALAEGVDTTPDNLGRFDPVIAYRNLWDSINAKRGFGWNVNPWVWALTFKTSANIGGKR